MNRENREFRFRSLQRDFVMEKTIREGHEFTRAAKPLNHTRASAPEVFEFAILDWIVWA